MVEIQVLPPRDEPERLTAKLTSHTLREHLEGFMSKNNAKGFVYEEPTVEIKEIPLNEIFNSGGLTISELLMLFAQHEYVSEHNFKRFVLLLRSRISVTTGMRPVLGHVYEMLGTLFGYKSHSNLKQYARSRVDERHPGMVRNFRYGEQLQKVIYELPKGRERWRDKEECKKAATIRQAFKNGRMRNQKEDELAKIKVTVKKKRTIQKEV